MYKSFHWREATISMIVLMLLVMSGQQGFVSATTATPTMNTTEEASPEGAPEPLEWPVAMPSAAQIAEAQACNILDGAKERKDATLNEPMAESEPPSACDWAIVARVYVERIPEDDWSKDDPIPVEGKQAFFNAIRVNPALAFNEGFFFGFNDYVLSVQAPPFSITQPLRRAEIVMDWTGGVLVPIYEFAFSVIITETEKEQPKVTGVLNAKYDEQAPTDEEQEADLKRLRKNGQFTATIDKVLVDTLAQSLTDMMPIKDYFYVDYCSHNHPNWRVKLVYKDGSTVELTNNRSNYYFGGGPMLATINQQKYMQYSGKVLRALLAIRDALDLPYGSTQSRSCGFINQTMELAYGSLPSLTPTKTR